MGINASWIAVNGAGRSAVLETLAFSDSGEPCWPYEVRFSVAEKGGWTFVVADRSDWVDEELVLSLSDLGLVLGLNISEIVMYSALTAARDGDLLWRVLHNREDYEEEVVVEGEEPEQLAKIMEALQAEADTSDEEYDAFFDAPIELARVICGFRLDEIDDAFKFTTLEGGAEDAGFYPPPSAASQRGGIIGFLARLFWR